MSYETNLQIGAKATPEDAFTAVTNVKRLSQWWCPDTRGDADKVGGTIEFWFGEFCQKFDVIELEPNKRVVWKAPAGQGAGEWEGTEVSFDLREDEKQTFVRFRHSGWRENTPFYGHCSIRWATFLLSLKALLETGKGRPVPDDVKVDY